MESMAGLFENTRRNSVILAINFVALLGLVFLPAGDYQARGAAIKVNAFSPPFSDYGVFLAASVGVFAAFYIAIRLRGYRRGVSSLGYVVISGAALGFITPDVITPGILTIAIGAGSRTVPVHTLIGFWLTFAGTLLLFILASVAFLGELKAKKLTPRSVNPGEATVWREFV
jgi:hypothetical protein